MNTVYNEIYKKVYGNVIFESITDKSSGNTEILLKMGTYPMYVYSLKKIVDVDLKVIINAVNRALGKISSKYEFMYNFIKWSRPIYVLGDPSDERVRHKTMSVDDLGNLYMNIHFIYNNLDCDSDKIFGILFHELMHIFLKHIERRRDIMSDEDLMTLSAIDGGKEHMKQNICMDQEVNCDMVADNIVSANFWKEMGGMFDEKYMGKMWEEIYKTDGDKLLKDYLEVGGKKLPEKYFEIIKEILKAIKILHNPKSTDKEKDMAASRIEDLLLELRGYTSKTKMTIRERLKKLQHRTNLKEIGEIGPYLKNVVDDLSVEPRNMSEEDLSKFSKDVEILEEEMFKNINDICDLFLATKSELEKDIQNCMESLISGVTKINKKKDLTAEEFEDITDEIIHNIDRLEADNKKKKELDRKRRELMKEKAERRKKKMEEEIEKAKNRHILKSYLNRLKDLAEIAINTSDGKSRERLSAESYHCCGEIIEIVETLVVKKTIEETTKEISSIGLETFKNLFKKLSSNLHKDLMELKKEKVLIDRDESFFDDICGRFERDNYELFKSFTDELNETELVSKVKIAISSIRRIGKELHRQKKVRPSEEYKAAYKEEYNRLREIYLELGEKGLRRELGLPEKEKITF